MELRSGKTLNRSLSATDVNGEEVNMPLPQELVERILAMVPFPQIFKALALSKSWHARLSPIASHADDEKKLLAVSFQKLVCEWSQKSKASCPVFLFADFLITYNLASQHWCKIPTLSLLPYEAAMKVKAHMLRDNMLLTSITGSLLFVTTSDPNIMFVVNIFTGSWKELPALPRKDRRPGAPERLVSTKEMYKVIRLYISVGCACAWIYDSILGAWRSKRLEVPEVLDDFELDWHDVYLNGVLYVMVQVQGMVWGFLAFDVKEETFNLLQMLPTGIISTENLNFLQIVACNGTVYIVLPEDILQDDRDLASRTVILLEADLVLRRWAEVIRGTPAPLEFGCFSHNASSDGESLFFQGNERDNSTSSGKILVYNVRKDEWSSFAMNPILQQCLRSFIYVNSDTSFQPGMNPFLEV